MVDLNKEYVGKTIQSINGDEGMLKISLEGLLPDIIIEDQGQSCCEYRYMVFEESELKAAQGSKLLDIKLAGCGEVDTEWGEANDIQFLEIVTSNGVISIANHNEHNGWYGGFEITLTYVNKRR